MNRVLRVISAFLLAAASSAGAAGDYVGILKPTSTAIAIPDPGFYWPLAGPLGAGLAPRTEAVKLKLGYRYSPYLSVETGYVDSGSVWAGSSLSATTPRARGFSMDTVGTLPLWKYGSLYGRLGAYSSGGAMPSLSASDWNNRTGAGLRYGLGLKYDFSGSFGVQAEMERFAPLDRWGTRESETDQVSVGVTWRF
jgi:hypothetical protein